MRMFAIPNQSSEPKAYELFTSADAEEGGSRLMAGGNRERLVDCVEEFVKYTIIMRPHFDLFGDRFSERPKEEFRAKPEVVNRVNGTANVESSCIVRPM
jgi:arsenical resistance protein ArsH